MEQTRWWRYVEGLIGDDNFSQAARKAGFDKSAFTRWKRGAVADPAFVIKLARAYRANVIQALAEAELITDKEAALRDIAPKVDLSEFDAEDLGEEVSRRLRRLSSVENELAKIVPLPVRQADTTLSEDDLAEVIREANQRPHAAHTEDNIEYVEPESP